MERAICVPKATISRSSTPRFARGVRSVLDIHSLALLESPLPLGWPAENEAAE